MISLTPLCKVEGIFGLKVWFCTDCFIVPRPSHVKLLPIISHFLPTCPSAVTTDVTTGSFHLHRAATQILLRLPSSTKINYLKASCFTATVNED